LTVFYALFYVVVEVYRGLNLRDTAIDTLLAKDNYENQLRRFRNAVFHFQEDPCDRRLIEFITADGSGKWIRELYRAFERLFMAVLPIADGIKRMSTREGVGEAMSKFNWDLPTSMTTVK
jgi:hypothetical protein